VNEPSLEGYHRIIVCLGISFDRAVFAPSAMPAVTTFKGYPSKFPALTPRFEARNVTNLFFLGSPMHSNDYKQAAGGFIHGFRYLVRSLHRILEQDDEEVATPWPKKTYHLPGYKGVMNQTITRLNTMGGPYQMFGHLADVLVISTTPDGKAPTPLIP
jgi:hypothetical protein